MSLSILSVLHIFQSYLSNVRSDIIIAEKRMKMFIIRNISAADFTLSMAKQMPGTLGYLLFSTKYTWFRHFFVTATDIITLNYVVSAFALMYTRGVSKKKLKV